MNWKNYWSAYPKRFARSDYLRQVKRTRGGEPVPDAEIHATVESIRDLLDLNAGDTLLDLCCGNGLITNELAGECRRVVGVDFSQTLIDIAESDHRPANVTYVCADVLDLVTLRRISPEPFSKILMVFALQHFKTTDLPALLGNVAALLADDGVALFAAVPDRACRGTFYNTTSRRLRRIWDGMTGRDQLGTWWNASEIERVCHRLGLDVRFGPSGTRTGHAYRFDARITRSGATRQGAREVA